MDTEEAVLNESGPAYGTDRYWMGLALREACAAAQAGEVPVGAVIVDERGQLLARDHNRVEQFNDVTAHAELLVCTAAAHALGGKYLRSCTLYVTLEPCAMCAAALRWFQLGRLVWGASDPKAGYRHFAPNVLHPKTRVVCDVEASACRQLLKAFFQQRRSSK
jgi:tRNA(adenine34) deaminase